jgi:hypothetical protein
MTQVLLKAWRLKVHRHDDPTYIRYAYLYWEEAPPHMECPTVYRLDVPVYEYGAGEQRYHEVQPPRPCNALKPPVLVVGSAVWQWATLEIQRLGWR